MPPPLESHRKARVLFNGPPKDLGQFVAVRVAAGSAPPSWMETIGGSSFINHSRHVPKMSGARPPPEARGAKAAHRARPEPLALGPLGMPGTLPVAATVQGAYTGRSGRLFRRQLGADFGGTWGTDPERGDVFGSGSERSDELGGQLVG